MLDSNDAKQSGPPSRRHALGKFSALHQECSPMKSPPATLLALNGRRLDSLSTAEKAVFQRYRNGRFRDGLPWISVGLTTHSLDPWELLRASTQAQADALLKRAGAVIQVRVYD